MTYQRKHLFFALFSTFVFLVLCRPSIAENADKTLSPYFAVKADSEGVDLLPLLSTEAEVNIAGVIADVTVTQIYKNDGKIPLEATYVFPGSTRAAVYGMKMTIGERIRIAKIKERTQAKKIYTEAKKAGKSASLLEQHRPNVFQMSVANIMPGDRIKVELSYTELLIPTEGVYEFIYPTVVGPRYSNQKASQAPASEQWVANPYLHEGEAPPYTFHLVAELNTGIPLQDVNSSSHNIDVSYDDKSRASILLNPSETFGGNRDFILRYRLEGKQIESGLLLYEGEEENFFLLMVQPPKQVTPDVIPPREYVFVVDVSGSMYGFPLEISKKVMKDLLSGLRSQDSFNIILFAGRSSILAEKSLPASPDNIRRAIALIDNQQGGGGTELLPALEQAMSLNYREDTSRSIVVVTDGYIAADVEAIALIQQNLNNANVFTFGIGSGVNRFLIEGLARAGYGEPFVVTKPAEGPERAERFKRYISSPVLTGIGVHYEDFEVYDVEPVSIPDVMAERPIIIFGKWRGNAQGTIRLTGRNGTGEYLNEIDVANTGTLQFNSALRYLWARARIQALSDLNRFQHSKDLVQQITHLGLTYNLLTKYTSFVAVDDVVRNPDGTPKKVKQPLPLPKGVSNKAVGGSVPTVPEPETYLLLFLVSLFLLRLFWKERTQQQMKI